MWPSTRATWSDAATSVDWVIFRELATTLKPRSTNAFTIPAPIPCEAPVTMAVFRWPLMVAYLENVWSLFRPWGFPSAQFRDGLRRGAKEPAPRAIRYCGQEAPTPQPLEAMHVGG